MNIVHDAILALQIVINFVEKIDPNAAENPIVKDLQAALNTLKALGL